MYFFQFLLPVLYVSKHMMTRENVEKIPTLSEVYVFVISMALSTLNSMLKVCSLLF